MLSGEVHGGDAPDRAANGCKGPRPQRQPGGAANGAFVGAPPSTGAVVALTTMENLVGTVVAVALFSAMMDAVRTGREATDYTVQASADVIVQGLGGVIGGGMAATLGYPAHFGLSAALAGLGVAAVAAHGEPRWVWAGR